jgi:hypothetical protein
VKCLPYEMRSIFHWGKPYFTWEFYILPIEVFRSIGVRIKRFLKRGTLGPHME